MQAIVKIAELLLRATEIAENVSGLPWPWQVAFVAFAAFVWWRWRASGDSRRRAKRGENGVSRPYQSARRLPTVRQS